MTYKPLDSRLLRQRLETFLNFPRGGLELCGAVYQRPSRPRSARRSALSSVFTTERRDPINGVARIGDHLYDAFIKAIGALAQVIYVITPDDQREQILNDANGPSRRPAPVRKTGTRRGSLSQPNKRTHLGRNR